MKMNGMAADSSGGSQRYRPNSKFSVVLLDQHSENCQLLANLKWRILKFSLLLLLQPMATSILSAGKISNRKFRISNVVFDVSTQQNTTNKII